MTSRDVATPHAPIAILLLHLQALYNVIILTFVIAISLFPGGAHTGGGRRRRKCLIAERALAEENLLLRQVGSRNGGLVAERGSLESLTDVSHALCEVKSGASSGALPNDRFNYRFK